MAEHPWDRNEHGLWCPACGYHIACLEAVDSEGFSAPEACRQCGFPDFEDGHGYFTDEA